jgi:hypothetical protein
MSSIKHNILQTRVSRSFIIVKTTSMILVHVKFSPGLNPSFGEKPLFICIKGKNFEPLEGE